MVTIMLRDGQKVTPWMDYQLGRLDHDMFNAFGVRVKVRSGIRTAEEQLNIWYERYVTSDRVNGRRVYDTRWWNGRLWYRISPAGTVAQPGTSNHEIQGDRAAVDLYDTGSDPGITSKNSARGRWYRENAWRYDMSPSGDGFGEGWHSDINNIGNTPPTPPAPPRKKETKVKSYHYEDATARKSGRTVKPGEGFYLHTTEGVKPSQATNIVGNPGNYSITPHVYATGTPGDVVELVLLWDATRTDGPHSPHYVERLIIDKDGHLNASREFKRGVAPYDAVYLRASTPATNEGPVQFALLDSDAYLFITA